MFGSLEDIRGVYPNYSLVYRENGVSESWKGNVYGFYFDALRRLRRLFPEDGAAWDALGEALGNCLINADYHSRAGVEVAAEAVRNAEVATLFVSNELETRARLTTLLREAVARGQVDGSLDLEQAATWLIIIFDGVVGRTGIDASFNPQAHAPTLRLLIERFLRPQSR